MQCTLVTGPGATFAQSLVSMLSAAGRVLVHEDPRTLHAAHLRDAGVQRVVYLPGLTRWTGMRSEPHALASLFDDCEAAGVAKLVVLSSHRVYGATSQHSLFLPETTRVLEHTEDPELRRLLEVDGVAFRSADSGRRTNVAVLRSVFVLGGNLGSSLEPYFGAPLVPHVFGFNPMTQLVHEHDLCRAIELALATQALCGVYHVTGSGSVPLSVVARERGVRRMPLIGGLGLKLNELAFASGRSAMPNTALAFLTHVLSVDGEAFARATGYVPTVSLRDTVLGRPARAIPPTWSTRHTVPLLPESDHAVIHA